MLEHFFHSEVFTITFVIGLYLINIKIHRWVQVPVLHSLLHPVLVTIIELILILTALKVPYETFREGSRMIHFMLGPSVVALGYILYEQVAHLKKNAISIIVAITIGAIGGYRLYHRCRASPRRKELAHRFARAEVRDDAYRDGAGW